MLRQRENVAKKGLWKAHLQILALTQRQGTKRICVPCLQAVISFKWQQWAQRMLDIELGFYLLWLLAFQVFVLLFQVSVR
jgi:hypothetical protein